MNHRNDLSARANWQVGQRVSRFDSDQHGRVVGVDAKTIKIKWDNGATSVFRHGKLGNVQFVSTPRKREPL